MSVIYTLVENKTRTPYQLRIPRKYAATIKGFDTLRLDFDLWSVVGGRVEGDLRSDIDKGILAITSCLEQSKAPTSKTEAAPVEPPVVPVEQVTTKSVGDGFSVLATGSDALIKAYGATESKEQPSENLSEIANKNLAENYSFHAIDQDEEAPTEDTEDTVEAASSEDMVDDEGSFSERIAELHESKDYAAIIDLLNKRFPAIEFGKRSIISLKSWEGIKEKYGLTF